MPDALQIAIVSALAFLMLLSAGLIIRSQRNYYWIGWLLAAAIILAEIVF